MTMEAVKIKSYLVQALLSDEPITMASFARRLGVRVMYVTRALDALSGAVEKVKIKGGPNGRMCRLDVVDRDALMALSAQLGIPTQISFAPLCQAWGLCTTPVSIDLPAHVHVLVDN